MLKVAVVAFRVGLDPVMMMIDVVWVIGYKAVVVLLLLVWMVVELVVMAS